MSAFDELGAILRPLWEADAKRRGEVAAALTQDQRLAAACWVMCALDDHLKEGGTFRQLIYGRLGFGPEAYEPLFTAGGMNVSNALNDQHDASPPTSGSSTTPADAGRGEG